MGEMRGDRSMKRCLSYPLADRGNPYKPPLFLLLKKVHFYGLRRHPAGLVLLKGVAGLVHSLEPF